MSFDGRAGIKDLSGKLSELLKDTADWCRANNRLNLALKLEEINSEEQYSYLEGAKLEARVRRAMRAIRTFGDFSPEEVIQSQGAISAVPTSFGQILTEGPPSDEVFVVHGHDDSILHQVMRLLVQLSLKGVVLRELPSEGRAIIEKLEHYSNVGFAIILMTADDMGGSAEQVSQGNFFPRARQNVVLELGYFAAKLSRKRLCVLKEAGVEEPSDILGIVYTEIDKHGAWRLALGKELRAAGYSVNLNDL